MAKTIFAVEEDIDKLKDYIIAYLFNLGTFIY